MTDYAGMVREFHETFGHPVADKPTLRDDKTNALRAALIEEEFEEFCVALATGDIVAIADAVGDLLVVVHGAALVYGIPIGQVFEEIHRSNMSKLDADGNVVPHPTVPGKIGKSELYSPPDLMPILFPEVLDA